MNAPSIMDNIIIGIITGVSAGLILAAFSYGKQYINHKVERREQIKYIRQIVEAFQEKILSVQQAVSVSNAPPDLASRPDAVHQLRWVSLGHTHEQVVRTLEGRASTLTFDEKNQLLDTFDCYVLFRPGGDLGSEKGRLLGEAQYHQIFDALEAVK